MPASRIKEAMMFQGKKIKQFGNGYTYRCIYMYICAYILYVHVCSNNEGKACCQTLRKALKIYDAGKKYTKT